MLLRLWLTTEYRARGLVLVDHCVERDLRSRFEVVDVLVGGLVECCWLVEVDLLSEVVQNELFQVDEDVS